MPSDDPPADTQVPLDDEVHRSVFRPGSEQRRSQRTLMMADAASGEDTPFVQSRSFNQALCRSLRVKSPKVLLMEALKQEDDGPEPVGEASINSLIFCAVFTATAMFSVMMLCNVSHYSMVKGFYDRVMEMAGPIPSRLAMAFGAMLLAGMVSPLCGFEGEKEGVVDAVLISFTKVNMFVLEVIFPVGLYYADVVTDYSAMRVFWETDHREFLYLNLVGIMVAAAYCAVLVRCSAPAWSGVLAGLALFQLLPAGCLLCASCAFFACGTAESMELEWSTMSIKPMLSCATFSESLLQALFGATAQTYSFLYHDLKQSQASTLRFSAMISIFSMTKGFTELDMQGKQLCVMYGVPIVTGAASTTDPALFAVIFYRAVAVVGRVLILVFFQIFTRDALQSLGAPLLVCVDIGIQLRLINRSTRNPFKCGFCIANVVSPAEPILHSGGDAIYTTQPVLAASAHLVEAVIAGSAAAYIQGRWGTATSEDSTDNLMLAAGVVCSLVQLPLLLLVRSLFAYEVESRETCGGAFSHLGPKGAAWCDKADLGAPLSMVALQAFKAERQVMDKVSPVSPLAAAIRLGWMLQERQDLRRVVRGSRESLDLVGSDFDDELSIAALSWILKTSTSLESVKLRENRIGDAGVETISKGLEENRGALETLNLWDCNIKARGATALAQMLKRNSRLKTLSLFNNGVGDEGAQAFAQVLKDAKDLRRPLKKLGLGANGIGETGVHALAEMLKTNKQLECLDLRGNNVGDSGAEMLADALRENRALRVLYLFDCSIGESGKEKLKRALLEVRENNIQLEVHFGTCHRAESRSPSKD